MANIKKYQTYIFLGDDNYVKFLKCWNLEKGLIFLEQAYQYYQDAELFMSQGSIQDIILNVKKERAIQDKII